MFLSLFVLFLIPFSALLSFPSTAPNLPPLLHSSVLHSSVLVPSPPSGAGTAVLTAPPPSSRPYMLSGPGFRVARCLLQRRRGFLLQRRPFLCPRQLHTATTHATTAAFPAAFRFPAPTFPRAIRFSSAAGMSADPVKDQGELVRKLKADKSTDPQVLKQAIEKLKALKAEVGGKVSFSPSSWPCVLLCGSHPLNPLYSSPPSPPSVVFPSDRLKHLPP